MYPSDIHLKSGRIVSAGTTIWAAGVAADQQWTALGDSDRLNRLVVDENLQLCENVWVIGDMAHSKDDDGQPLPMVASVATHQGRYVASVMMGKTTEPFSYKDKGQMATVGRRLAVVELPNGLRLHGTLAWLSWLAQRLNRLRHPSLVRSGITSGRLAPFHLSWWCAAEALPGRDFVASRSWNGKWVTT